MKLHLSLPGSYCSSDYMYSMLQGINYNYIEVSIFLSEMYKGACIPIIMHVAMVMKFFF